MENLRKLELWLNEPCDELETMINPLGGGAYIPIDLVNKKIKFAETMFEAKFRFKNFSHFISPVTYYFGNREVSNIGTHVSGSIEVDVVCFSDEHYNEGSYEVEVDSLVGSATFNINDYAPNTHWGATCKSLCISNALLKYPQFGALLNNQRVDFAVASDGQPRPKKKATIIEEQKLKNAYSAGDETLIQELNDLYDFSNATTD